MFQSLVPQLKNPDPVQRIQAVRILASIRHPRARQVLRYVYFNDPDPQVRSEALQHLPGIRARLAGMPAPQSSQPKEVIWDCVYCGTRDIKGGSCPNCAAPRPHEADEQVAQASDQPVNTNLDELFRLPPPGMRPANRAPAPRPARRSALNAMLWLFLLLVILSVVFWASRAWLIGRHILVIR